MWLVSLPVQVECGSPARLVAVAVVGVLLWLVGLDLRGGRRPQLTAFKADPANKGKVMDRGLWSWTRHPNYFGDSCVWWGIWLVAASAWPGVLTVLSPVSMTYFLVFAHAGPGSSRGHMADVPATAEYQQRTSYFLPRPPKKAEDLSSHLPAAWPPGV